MFGKVTPDMLFLILLFVWSGVLTIFFIRFYFYYNRLTKNGKKESITELLDEVLNSEKENKKVLDELSKRFDRLEKDGALHIQKIGLLRFNPFKDTGGDQSFILALVDAEGTGVVISSLHTRGGTRWYAKQVVRQKGAEYALSDEEVKALKLAKPIS